MLRRYHKGECTRCGRDRGSGEVWCKRCADIARERGKQNPDYHYVTEDQWPAYFAALRAWAQEAPVDEQLREALSGVQKLVEAEEDPKELARYLIALNALRRELGDLVDEVSARMYGRLDKKETDLGEGIGIVARSRQVNTSWNHEDLFHHIVSSHRGVDPITGEVFVDGQALADDIRALVAFSYWRKTELRSRHINPEDFSTVVFGKPTIRFMSREGKA